MSLETHFDETLVARLASREKQMQQNYRPVISVHKWFARRPGALFRSLALAEFEDGQLDVEYTKGHELQGVCLDPFMGGGTPVFEASRLGMSVIGFDTNPMSRWVVERELEDVDPDEFARVGERVACDVETRVGELYKTSCPTCDTEADVRYFLWLRHHVCKCAHEHPLLADTMLVSAAMKRHPREVHLCPHCLSVDEFKPGKRPARCRGCRKRYDNGVVPPDSIQACACGETFRIPPRGSLEEPLMKLVAVEYSCGACADKPAATAHTYKRPDDRDHRLVVQAQRLAAKLQSSYWPAELIPSGMETQRLLRWGYNRWADLFSARQLYGLGVLAERINEEPPGPVRRALQTAFSDFLRFQTVLCRYDRQALKPTDVFAVHGFPVPRVSCEPALLGTRGAGSGGFRHALAKYERAKRWCRAPYESVHDGRRLHRHDTAPEKLTPVFREQAHELANAGEAALFRGTLSDGKLRPGSVDIVLTDPPYFANVQYAELMEFCFTWLRRLAPETPYFDVPRAKTADDAVGAARGVIVDLAEFSHRLSQVYCAATDALKPGGVFAFTYHHNDLDAYAPVVVACLDAGLVPTKLFGCPSEMRASTHIRGRNASTTDTVFVLRKPPVSERFARTLVEEPVQQHVDGRLSALSRAGMTTTPADRACVRHSVLAAQAIVALGEDWDATAPVAERLERALRALGLTTESPSITSAPA